MHTRMANGTERHSTSHNLGERENEHLVCQGKLQAGERSSTPLWGRRCSNTQQSARPCGEMVLLGEAHGSYLSVNNGKEVEITPATELYS